MEAKMVSNRLKISIFLINGLSFDDEKPIKITFISAKEVFKNLTKISKFWSFLNRGKPHFISLVSNYFTFGGHRKLKNSEIQQFYSRMLR